MFFTLAGTWEQKFPKEMTHYRNFRVNERSNVRVPMMTNKGNYLAAADHELECDVLQVGDENCSAGRQAGRRPPAVLTGPVRSTQARYPGRAQGRKTGAHPFLKIICQVKSFHRTPDCTISRYYRVPWASG